MINLKKQDPVADAVKEILQQEALKGNQTKIDKNHNGKIDGQDFKILRGEKKAMKEEETVEEGIKDVAKKAFKALTGGSDKDQLDALRKRMYKPEPAKKPSDKAMGEEVEQIEELNKSTLSSYVKKANQSTRDAAMNLGYKAGRKEGGAEFVPVLAKRRAGIEKASDKLAKEEVEGKTLRQFMENAFDYKSPRKPEPNGGSGMKQGSRYGGSKQKDKPEQDTDEKK